MTTQEYARTSNGLFHNLQRIKAEFEKMDNDFKVFRRSPYQTYYSMRHRDYIVLDEVTNYMPPVTEVEDGDPTENEMEARTTDEAESDNNDSDPGNHTDSSEELEFQQRLQGITQQSDSVRYRPTRSHRTTRDRADDKEYEEISPPVTQTLNELPSKLVLTVQHPIRRSDWIKKKKFQPDRVDYDHFVNPSISLKDLSDNKHIQTIISRFD